MEATVARNQSGRFRRFWKNASFRLKFGIIGLTIVMAFALIVPLFYPGDPTTHYQVTAKLSPCAEHPLGTTRSARMCSRCSATRCAIRCCSV